MLENVKNIVTHDKGKTFKVIRPYSMNLDIRLLIKSLTENIMYLNTGSGRILSVLTGI